MQGVVFDFFGTLTDPGNEQHRREVYDATAAALGVPATGFWQAVTSSARRLHAPRPGALDVLRALRRRGFRIALLSDCSSELREAWGLPGPRAVPR